MLVHIICTPSNDFLNSCILQNENRKISCYNIAMNVKDHFKHTESINILTLNGKRHYYKLIAIFVQH
jgi:hypothetical protein